MTPDSDAELTQNREKSTWTPSLAPTDTHGILVVRAGPGANCSSIGSAVEMLFLSATVGAAVLLAVSAALNPDRSASAPPPPPSPEGPPPPDDPAERPQGPG
jgi:hypothetical protein